MIFIKRYSTLNKRCDIEEENFIQNAGFYLG